ncbi:MAG TPA: hypothetical protein VGT98_15755 [Candidatus Elarobacter sp.]|nr:hypothetical protein [Candidatus Elarobacter sp.]
MNEPGRARVRALQARHAAPYVALACLVLAGAPSVSRAQLAVDHMELLLDPQSSAQRVGVIGVRNDGDKRVQATLRLEDWDRAEDGDNHWYPLGTRPGSCGNALHLFPLSVVLEPGASQSMRVTFDSAAPPMHECWAAAVVETAQPRVLEGRSVLYMVRTAVKIYVAPPGLAASGAVTDMRITPARAIAASAMSAPQIEVVFSNTGDRHIVARGSVELRRADNSLAAKIALPDIHVLPGAKGRVTVPLPLLAAGRYVALGIMDYGGDEIAAAQVDYEVP